MVLWKAILHFIYMESKMGSCIVVLVACLASCILLTSVVGSGSGIQHFSLRTSAAQTEVGGSLLVT